MIPEAMSRFPGHENFRDAALLGILSGRFRVGAFLPSWPTIEAIAIPAGDWMPYEILEKSPDPDGKIFVTVEYFSGERFRFPAFLISGFWWLTHADVANALIQKSQTVFVNNLMSHDPAKDRNQLPGAFPIGKYVIHPLEPPEVSVLDLWIYESGEGEVDEPQEQSVRAVTKDPRLEIISKEWAAVFDPATRKPALHTMANKLAGRPDLGNIGFEALKKLLGKCSKPPGWVPNTSRKGRNQ